MESKLRNEKVVDLKKILTGAKITIPAKANKAELIQTILKSSDALAYYDAMKTDRSGEASAAGTPAPSAPIAAKQADAVAARTEAPKDDLLAPLEEFDWSTGQTSASSEPTTVSTKTKPSSKVKGLPTTSEGAKLPTNPSSENVPSSEQLDPEEEAKKRRAERFGTKYVPPKSKPAATLNSPTAAKSQAANGKVSGTHTENADVLKSRADRFGIVTKTKQDATVGQKRGPPVDAEEEERRRKRAERFGLPVAKPADNAEADELKRKRAERFAKK